MSTKIPTHRRIYNDKQKRLILLARQTAAEKRRDAALNKSEHAALGLSKSRLVKKAEYNECHKGYFKKSRSDKSEFHKANLRKRTFVRLVYLYYNEQMFICQGLFLKSFLSLLRLLLYRGGWVKNRTVKKNYFQV